MKADEQESFNAIDKAEFKKLRVWAKEKNNNYINQFIKIRQDSERVELLGPGSGGSDPVTNREVASEALRIQKENKDITGNIISELAETKEIAVNATEMLEMKIKKRMYFFFFFPPILAHFFCTNFFDSIFYSLKLFDSYNSHVLCLFFLSLIFLMIQ